MLRHSCSFRIWNLNYRLCSDSAKAIRYFKRLYSLFNDCGGIKGLPERNILLQMPLDGKRCTMDIIDDITSQIYKTWMQNFSRRVFFIHASAIELEQNFLLLMGGPRSGKSTIAAMLGDDGAKIYSDDFTPLEYKTISILNFPMFSNIRKGNLSKLQKKYLFLLKPYFKKFNRIRREHLINMTDEEFKAYYSYNKELYNKNGQSDSNRAKKIVAIFLRRCNSSTSKRLQKIEFPQSFNMFINALHMPLPVFKKILKPIIKVFGDIDFYALESSSVRETVELIQLNFG